MGGGPPLPASPTAPVPTPTPTPAAAKVLILSVDGLRPDALDEEGVSSIPALMARGATAQAATTIVPSLTLPAHTSMLTGYAPAAHGVLWNDWRPDAPAAVPSIFLIARRAGFRTVLVAGKQKFRSFDAPGCLDAFAVRTGDVAVANEAVVQMAAGFDLMLVHLPDVDAVGHLSGWLSPAYLEQVAETDRALGRILLALPAGTTVILTADHGGHGKTHGLDQPSDMSIPWIVAGPGVAQGSILAVRVTTMDTAATALHVLGLRLPTGASGRPVLEAFRGLAGGLRPAA
jgi:arylsulfatase A-like enzyme